ncbi:MAG: ABC transporter ATP-binding protein [Myxococcales bacterium]|nr:ABC transporter ATP-binding protein [Myxococcales bacterium]
MSDAVIVVDNLSKRYRIGESLRAADSFRERIAKLLRAPLDNLRRVWRMTHFDDEAENILWALRDVSFAVKEGEVLGIIGRNGAGKSTLLKILSRITLPSFGSVRLRGKVGSLLEVGTGFHPELTGRENIYLNGAILGMRKAQIDASLDEIIEFAGVARFIDTPVKRYSSGMWVRLAFSVAAHFNPEVLMIDEVLSVGDAAFRKRCLGRMRDVAKSGRTVLFVSHNIGVVNTLCDRCLLLDNGRLLFDGPTALTIKRYLEASASDAGAEVFPDSPSDRFVSFERLALRTVNGERKAEFDVFEPALLEVDYTVHEEVDGGNLGLTLKKDGTIILNSFDTDLDDERLHQRPTGRYRATIALPCPLKSGHYELTLHAGLTHVVRNVELPDVLSFDVVDISYDTSLKSYSRHAMLVAPLRWQATPRDDE